MLGHMFSHLDGAYKTYHRFLSKLQSAIYLEIDDTKVCPSNLIVGSDEETALMKAMKKCFPSSAKNVCTRHVEENVRNDFDKKLMLG